MNFESLSRYIQSAFIEYPETKDSHNLLILHIWAKQNPIFQELVYSLSQKDMISLAGCDSIIRQARLIQNGPDGRFKPSTEAIERRKGSAAHNTVYYRENPKERAQAQARLDV